MSGDELLKRASRFVANTYSRFPICLVRGEGSRVWDTEGREYLDFVSGLAVVNVGHSHPRIVEAICKQAGELLHVSNLYHIKPQILLAQRLCELSFADKVFFCNSGAEANEAAIKLARKYSWERWGEGRAEIITMMNSFHGRTLGTLTATAQEKFHKGFAPLMPGFRYVPFDDIGAVREALTEATCAVMLEPIQGEGGVNLPRESYLKELGDLCRERELLLIYDEIQTGMGRTGKLFAYQNWDVSPDIMTLAKGLAGGCPIGAMLAREEVAAAFKPGDHASTFGGNPLATAAGLAALEVLSSEGTLSHCRAMGERMREGLRELSERHPAVREVRGMGLLNAVELDQPGAPLVARMMEKGFLINCTMERVVRFLPPLIVREEAVNSLLKALDETLAELTRGASG